jgi:hypothetical protein
MNENCFPDLRQPIFFIVRVLNVQLNFECFFFEDLKLRKNLSCVLWDGQAGYVNLYLHYCSYSETVLTGMKKTLQIIDLKFLKIADNQLKNAK